MLIVTPQKDVWTEIVEYLSEKLASLIYGGSSRIPVFPNPQSLRYCPMLSLVHQLMLPRDFVGILSSLINRWQ